MRLTEHNSYITLSANKIGVQPQELESVWDNIVAIQKKETPELAETDPMFTNKVMNKFDSKLDLINIEKARNIIMTREESIRHGQSWIDSLAQGNYVKANEAFPQFVKASYNSLLDNKGKEFLTKFAEKLKNSDKHSK
jgi:hypothetical protein